MDSVDSVDTYAGSGMGAYGPGPFQMGMKGTWYINKSDGYLYGAGQQYGLLGLGHNTNQTTFTKVGVQSTYTSTGDLRTGFYKPLDYHVSNDTGMVVDSSGKVWTAGRNNSMNLGWGSSYTSTSYTYFRTVATSNSGNYLPSNYQAVAVAGEYYAQMILTSTGALYGAGQSSYLGGNTNCASGTFYRLDGLNSLPAATASNPIVDFDFSFSDASYVLYKNGDLYRGTSSWTKINPSGVTFTMFDAEGYYCYAVTSSNTIRIYYNGTLSTTITPTGTVTQVRGSYGLNSSYGGWGYLNSAGALYVSTSATGTPSTSTYYNSGVTYFDLGGVSTTDTSYGIVQNGVTKFWGTNTVGMLGNGSSSTTSSLAYTSAYQPSNVDTTYMPEPLDRDISNTPPAICHLPRK